jgi:two-component system NtrC family sensor kinase
MSHSEFSPAAQAEIEQLRAKVATLEELLVVYEESAVGQADELQQALTTLQERAQQLTHATTTLQTLQSILDSMGEAVVVVNQQRQVLFANAASYQVLGIDPTVVSLEDWAAQAQVCLPDQQTPYPVEDLPLTRALQGEAVDSAELFLRQSLVPWVQWLSANAGPLQDEQGQVIGGVVAFRDATARKASEVALYQSRERAEQQAAQLQQALNELQATQAQLIQTEKLSGLGQMVAGMAHEINNPVNFIYGNLVHVETYVEGLLDLVGLYRQELPQPSVDLEAAVEALDLDFVARDLPNLAASMRSGADRIRQIVLSLRNFARLDESDRKVVDLHEGIESTLLILQRRLRPKPDRTAVAVVRQYGDLPQVECYPGQLNQVFFNILTNALDAMRALRSQPNPVSSPQITISTSQIEANHVRIDISNNGPSIPADIQSRIFDPFFTTKPVGQGIGMGLSICYRTIVDLHQGRLTCLSSADQAVTFRIEIPLVQG